MSWVLVYQVSTAGLHSMYPVCGIISEFIFPMSQIINNDLSFFLKKSDFLLSRIIKVMIFKLAALGLDDVQARPEGPARLMYTGSMFLHSLLTVKFKAPTDLWGALLTSTWRLTQMLQSRGFESGADAVGFMTVGNSIYQEVLFIDEDAHHAWTVFEVPKKQLCPDQSLPFWAPVIRW